MSIFYFIFLHIFENRKLTKQKNILKFSSGVKPENILRNNILIIRILKIKKIHPYCEYAKFLTLEIKFQI